MPSFSLETYAAWSNYHLTLGKSPRRGLPPAMTIEHMRRIHCADVDETDPLETMGATAGVLMHALLETKKDTQSRWGPRPANQIAAGVVGRAWSFAPVIGTPFAQIMAEGLSWIGEFPMNLRTRCAKKMNLCLCGAGTRLRELVTWAESSCDRRSIETSGTHLGPTVAGTFGTGSHGSRLKQGGFQNLIHGMHIVTDDQKHVWLQRKSRPVMKSKAIEDLIAKYRYIEDEPCSKDLTANNEGGEECCKKPVDVEIECIEITDDEHFDNALIHLGCMGVINAVALELTEIERFAVMGWAAPIDCQWLDDISAGNFDKLAPRLAPDSPKPEFYELTIDPLNPYHQDAAHVFYFSAGETAPFLPNTGVRPTVTDTLALVAAGKLLDDPEGPDPARLLVDEKGAVDPPGPSIDEVLRFLLKGENTLLKAYIKDGCFKKVKLDGDKRVDFGESIAGGTWGDIHPNEISGGIPGALYNASFAIDLCNVRKAVEAISAAVQQLSPSFLFTLRFVNDVNENRGGNLAFTRFPKCAVIEIDGLSRHICEQTIYYGRQNKRRNGRFSIHMEAALDLMASTVERGAEAVKRALTDEGIKFSMHWAKLGNINERGELDADKVLEDFGQDKIHSWRETRCKLLTEQGQLFFRNKAAEGYGLLPSVADQCSGSDPC